MGMKTNIEWCDHSFSPWIGCTKVSPGCKNCYAETLDQRYYGGTHWGKDNPRKRTSESTWRNPVKWNAKQQVKIDFNKDQFEAECQAYDGATLTPLPRPRVFPSLCDWLDDEVPIEWLADFVKLIHDTPNLDWLLLTKRPENWRSRIEAASALWEDAPDPPEKVDEMMGFLEGWLDCLDMPDRGGIPKNIWIGVSVENQDTADQRIPQLLQIPARVRFLSVEPLLSKVDLNRIQIDGETCDECKKPVTNSCLSQTAHCDCCVEGDEPIIFGPINWVIIGGESGPNRRDCGVEAICDVARQCVAAYVPCFVKQASAFKPGQQGRIPDDIWGIKQFPNE